MDLDDLISETVRSVSHPFERLQDVIAAETRVKKVLEVPPGTISSSAVFKPQNMAILVRSDLPDPWKSFAVAHEAGHVRDLADSKRLERMQELIRNLRAGKLSPEEGREYIDAETRAWDLAGEFLKKAGIPVDQRFQQRREASLKTHRETVKKMSGAPAKETVGDVVKTEVANISRGIVPAYGNARHAVPTTTPSGAQKGQGNIGGARNRGRPGYPVPQALATKRGAEGFEDPGFEVLEGAEKKEHSGTCVMLKVPPEAAERLADLGGSEKPDDMHITLFYKKGLTKRQIDTVEAVMGDLFTERGAPFAIKLRTVGSFSPSESSDWKKVIFAKVEDESVKKFRKELIDRLKEYGIEPSMDHGPEFKPHITLAYIDPDGGMPISLDEPVEFEIDEFEIARGKPAPERVDEAKTMRKISADELVQRWPAAAAAIPTQEDVEWLRTQADAYDLNGTPIIVPHDKNEPKMVWSQGEWRTVFSNVDVSIFKNEGTFDLPDDTEAAADRLYPEPGQEPPSEPRGTWHTDHVQLLQRFGDRVFKRIGASFDPARAFIDAGSSASAFDMGNGKVFKITRDVTDAAAMLYFKMHPAKHVVRVFDVFEFPSFGYRDPYYGITVEKLDRLDSDEASYMGIISSFINNANGRPWSEVEADLVEHPRVIEILKAYGLDEMIDEFHRNGFNTEDFHSGNVMKRKDGTFVMADLGLSTSRGDVSQAPKLEKRIYEGGPIDRMTGATDLSGAPRVDDVGLDDAQAANEASNTLRGIAAATMLGLAQPAPAQEPTDLAQVQELVVQAAEKEGIPPELLAAVVRAESGGDTNAVSPKGARGLGQLMPATARAMGAADPHDPKQNLFAAAKYLKRLIRAFRGNIDHVLAAYNFGPNAVLKTPADKYPQETKDYVKKVKARLPAGFKIDQPPAQVGEVIEAVLSELGMGGLETGVGFSRGGAWGASGWSRATLAGDDDGDEMFQQMMRSPSTRMLPMTNSGAPNSDLPGINKISGEPEDDKIADPTDLDEVVEEAIRKITERTR